MSAKDLTKKYIEFANRYEMSIDTSLMIEEALLIHEMLVSKDIEKITEYIIKPLYQEYSDCDSNEDRKDIIALTTDLLTHIKGDYYIWLQYMYIKIMATPK